MRRALAALVCLVLVGCAGEDDELTVYAAASLTEVFEELAPDARFNFAGSDELATQIREGAEADVYAAASPRHPDQLFEEGLVEEPRIFATNRLVLIVPTGNPAGIESVRDLRGEGVKLVVGAEGVPIGDYTRAVLEAMGAADVLDRVVSQEEDVKGVLGKVALGEADAGFAYATDVKAAADEVRAIELPADVQAEVRYPVAIVTEGRHRRAAEAFVDMLLSEEGRKALEAAGFGAP